MSEKNFYELDFIIEINERRFDQYNSAFEKVLYGLTHIILIYSGLVIFLIPIIQDISEKKITHWAMGLFFSVFCILIIVSLFFTIRLIIPPAIAYLKLPKQYYEKYRLQYERIYTSQSIVHKLLKSSYIDELEKGLTTNKKILIRKSSFYYYALVFGLLSIAPYLVCLGFHISKRENKIQNLQTMKTKMNGNVHKIDTMPKLTFINTSDNKSKPIFGIKTKLPGVDSSLVIVSDPELRKVTSSRILNDKITVKPWDVPDEN
jgi:hypothetical protein